MVVVVAGAGGGRTGLGAFGLLLGLLFVAIAIAGAVEVAVLGDGRAGVVRMEDGRGGRSRLRHVDHQTACCKVVCCPWGEGVLESAGWLLVLDWK